jgi:hypothetical protein
MSLVSGTCQQRWIESSPPWTALDAGPNVSSSLSLGSLLRSVGLRFSQCRFRHTRLALTTPRSGNFLLRGLPCMLWLPSSFEVWGKQGVHETFHQFQQLALHSRSAASTAHGGKNLFHSWDRFRRVVRGEWLCLLLLVNAARACRARAGAPGRLDRWAVLFPLVATNHLFLALRHFLE